MMMVWPIWLRTWSNTVRGTRSVALPGENGTMTRTVLVGQVLRGGLACRRPAPCQNDHQSGSRARHARSIVTFS